MNNLIIAIIRTLVPYVIGAGITWLVSLGVNVPADIEASVTLGLVTLIASLYYIAIAWLERKFPWFGWLLGVARNPVYEPQHSTATSTLAGGTAPTNREGRLRL